MAQVTDQTDPLEETVRQVACDAIKGESKEPVQKVQTFLEKHENKIPVKLAWLAHHALYKQNKDVLMLAKARDRILNRLLNGGLNLEKDFPAFLRISGGQGGERFRQQTDNVEKLRVMAGSWIEKSCEVNTQFPKAAVGSTVAYKDLMFAFGLAKLGEVENARKIQAKATKALDSKDAVHSILSDGYNYRINECILGKPHSGPLPDSVNKALAEMWKKATTSDEKVLPFKVVRLQGKSCILCPSERTDSYRWWKTNTDDLAKELAALHDEAGAKAEKELKRLMKGSSGKNWFRVVLSALEMAGNLSESFTAELLEKVCSNKELGTVENSNELDARVRLIERALFLSAHYDLPDRTNTLVKAFLSLFESQKDLEKLEELAGHCLKGLRKLGLREEIDRLLKKLTELVTGGKSLAELDRKDAAQWGNTLRVLLSLAAGNLYFGKEAEALLVLEEARKMLFKNDALQGVPRLKMVCRYAETLGQCPVEMAMKSYQEIFKELGPVNDSYTTNTHFSLSQLEVVEAVIMAIVSDAGIGKDVRRWMDEEEYLVRRRIHRDVRQAMEEAKL